MRHVRRGLDGHSLRACGWRAGFSPTPGCPRARRQEVTTVRVLVVVEDDEDAQDLIETVFSLDSRFILAGVSATAEDAFEMARTNKAGLIVLDHVLAGELTGIQADRKSTRLTSSHANIS